MQRQAERCNATRDRPGALLSNPDHDAARAALERRLNAGAFASAWSDGAARELDTAAGIAHQLGLLPNR